MTLTLLLWCTMIGHLLNACAWGMRKPGSRVTSWTQRELNSITFVRVWLMLWALFELVMRFL